MQHLPDWMGEEQALAARLPAAPLRGAALSAERALLLADLGRYAKEVVRSARGSALPEISAAAVAADLNWLLRPVFVCGHHRSGTTLLLDLLDGHPDLLALPSEGTYFSSFRRVACVAPGADDLDAFAAEWVARFVDPNYEPHFKLGRSSASGNPYVDFVRRLFSWQAALQRACPQVAEFASLLALAAAYRDTVAPGRQPRIWVEKTPLNERFLRRFDSFGRARFIQLVRDPRDTLASLLALLRDAGVSEPDSVDCASGIGHSLRLAHAHSRRHPQRYLVVRYEDLVDDSAQTMQRVCHFLQIAPHAALLTPTSVSQAVRSNSSFVPAAPGVIQRSVRAPQLGACEMQVLSALTAGSARQFGYALAPVDPWMRFRTHVRELPFALKRYLKTALS